jgi:hypothetical protein
MSGAKSGATSGAKSGTKSGTKTGTMTAVLLVAGLLACGCIGVSQKRTVAGAVGGTGTDVKTCHAGTRVADDGLIDDFEDGNTQSNLEGGRDGYWWPKKDTFGSTLEPDPFAPSSGAADGSDMAMHAFGKTSSADGAWGAGFGVNFLSGSGFYDASKYAGFTFKAKAAPGTSTSVRFKIGDVNTHMDGHVCSKACWNHFGKNLILTSEWKEYKVSFSEARQEPDWGDPRPESVTPSKLVSIDWSIGTGQTYDIWVDDLAFTQCK